MLFSGILVCLTEFNKYCRVLKARVLCPSFWYTWTFHKSKASHMCSIRKEVILNLLEDFLTLCICAQNFYISYIKYYSVRFQYWAEQNKVRSLKTSLEQVNSTSQLDNLWNESQKQLPSKKYFFKPAIFMAIFAKKTVYC